ncbi:MAG: hypothetical protein NC548_33330 [Lachnospiraceae bacterium]|nr:hypothetical protein [Lachnospiraceae bacterium]
MGVIKIIEKCMPGNYGAPGEKRDEKRKRTPEDIRRQNERNRWRRMQRIILANFHPGDWHLILKYRKGEEPETYEEAEKQRKKFLDSMRRAYKKAGIPFKWIAVTERGKKGQVLHHHLIIEDIDWDGINTVKLVKKLWTYGNGFFVEMYEDGEYEKLAEYIVKSETKEECGWCTYSRSRNLVVPEARKEKIYARKWRNPPAAPKGWYVVKDSVWNGENPVTGQPVQHYTLKKLITTRQGGKEGGSG